MISKPIFNQFLSSLISFPFKLSPSIYVRQLVLWLHSIVSCFYQQLLTFKDVSFRHFSLWSPLVFPVHSHYIPLGLKSTVHTTFFLSISTIFGPFIYSPYIPCSIIIIIFSPYSVSVLTFSSLANLWLNPSLYLLHICFYTARHGCRKT